jgi:aspartate/methionine/tyrosine aminotransferase
MKAAWLLVSGPENLKNAALERLEIVADTYLSLSAPIQLAMPTFLEQRHQFQKRLLARIRANLAALEHAVALNPSSRLLTAEAGWYAVLRIPVTTSDEAFAVELLNNENVYVHPGHFYNFPSEGYVVVSLIGLHDDFAEGVRRLLRMAQKML